MSAKILDGKILAQRLKDELKSQIKALKARSSSIPKLINLIIGSNPGACAYAASQQKAAEYIGLDYELKSLPENITQQKLIDLIKQVNRSEERRVGKECRSRW